MSAETALRLFGHPGLRQVCAKVNVTKLKHESIRSICNQLKDTMMAYGIRSVSAPQLGYKYRMFALDTVFYEDFTDEKAEFEQLFLSEPQTDEEFERQHDGLNSYLNQLEFHLNNHVPYQNDLQSIEQHFEQQTSEHAYNEEMKPMICINPTWIPLDLDQSIFEMEQKKGNMSKDKSDNGTSSSLYTTLLFGCNGVRTSCNYEQCLSFPELMVKRQRYNRIRAEFYNENGQKQICYLKSQDARAFQHECDHLDGRLMTDGVGWHDENSIIYVDEYLRRQQILKPQIEALISEISPAQQDELYKIYDPLHPPCDEELIEILQSVLQRKDEQQQQIVQQANDPDVIEMTDNL
eukprot:231570_1